MIGLSRRAILAMPLLLAACGSDDEAPEPAKSFPPLRYDYLPPLQLNVARIDIQQRFLPAGVPPDITGMDPVQPSAALKAMANDRLQALGANGRALFAILDASLTRRQDIIRGSLSVSLAVYDADNQQRGYATASVERTHTGKPSDLRATLYDMTKTMMDAMNVEFEYQVRRNLKDWLTTGAAPDMPVKQDPLGQPRR